MEIAICSNPWCRVRFEYEDMEEIPIDNREKNINEVLEVKEDEVVADEKQYRKISPPKFCKKCVSFDTDLSGGISWSDRWDGSIKRGNGKIVNSRNQNNYGRSR